jgi:hypothetical protein
VSHAPEGEEDRGRERAAGVAKQVGLCVPETLDEVPAEDVQLVLDPLDVLVAGADRPIVPFVRRRLVLRGATLLPMFTEGRLAMALTTRELAYRRDGGIEVALLWNTVTGRLTVTVADLASGEAFQLPLAPDRALDGFYHPYAYAASMGVVYGDAPLHALYA